MTRHARPHRNTLGTSGDFVQTLCSIEYLVKRIEEALEIVRQ